MVSDEPLPISKISFMIYLPEEYREDEHCILDEAVLEQRFAKVVKLARGRIISKKSERNRSERSSNCKSRCGLRILLLPCASVVTILQWPCECVEVIMVKTL